MILSLFRACSYIRPYFITSNPSDALAQGAEQKS